MPHINQDLKMETMEHRIVDTPTPGAPDAAHDPLARTLELGARIVEHGERKSVVACSVRQGSVECATAEVVAVRVKGLY